MASTGKVIKLVAKPLTRKVHKNGIEEVNLGDRSVLPASYFGWRVGRVRWRHVQRVVRLQDGASYIFCNVCMELPDGIITFQTFIEEKFPAAALLLRDRRRHQGLQGRSWRDAH